MTNSQRLASVRTRLLCWISESTESVASEKIVGESILICNEFYVGRRFRTESHRAVWFIEEDELKIYDADNQLLCVMSSEEIDRVDDHPAVIKMPQLVENQVDENLGNTEREIRRAA